MMTVCTFRLDSSLALAFVSSPLSESVADKARRLQLEGLRSHDFHLLLLMTALVAVGVIMEGPEIVHEARNAWLQCRHRRVRHRSVAPWITLIGALGWLFVAIGVAGEGYWEVQVSHDDEAITSLDEGKLGAAELAAGAANERADKLEAANLSLQGQLAKALAESDSSERDAVFAKTQAGRAEKDLEASLERTKKLETQLSWRTVTQEQRENLRNLLRSKGTFLPLRGFKISFSFPIGNPEAEEYAEELMNALDGLGAEVTDPSPRLPAPLGPKTFKGVVVLVNRGLAVDSLLVSLNKVGIKVEGQEPTVGQAIDPFIVQFFVGLKP